MPTRIVTIFFTFFSCVTIFAQQENLELFYYSSHQPTELNENNYERLKSTTQEYRLQHGKVKGFDEKQFVFEYNYFLDRINRSGNVFYGDEISAYLNNLKDWIVTQNNIKVPIKLYLTDYTNLNAFTNDFGNIYVNIATIAKLNSEKELLIILAHEIGHILSHHSRETELYSRVIKEKIDLNQEEGVFQLHAFSRSHEISADSIAHVLLKGVVQESDFIALFDKLKYSENPAYSGPVNFNYLFHSGFEYENFITEKYKTVDKFPKPYQNVNDSLSTHPSVEHRKQFTKDYYEHNSITNVTYTPIDEYEKVKRLASLVLVNSYVHTENYIEALDLILKLREKKDNPDLKNLQYKVLNLLVQAKYKQDGFELIDINVGCNDQDFIQFKQFIRSLSKIDLNIIVSKIISQISVDTTIHITEETAFQLFFDNNSNLFIKDSISNTYHYKTWEDDITNCIWLKKDSLFKEYEKILDSLGYKESCFDIPLEKSELLKNYMTNQQVTNDENRFIQSYFNKTSGIADHISSEKIELFMHPAMAADKFYRGQFFKSPSFDINKKSVLIQSDNLFFVSKDQKDFKFNYEKSLKLDAQLFDLSDRYNSFSKNYSMLYGGKTTVLDNYLHKIILIWMFERASDGKFLVSCVEDEIQKHLVDKQIDYVVYRLSILNRNKGKGRKFNINYYEVYFDIKTGGVVYVAQIGSKQFPDRFQIEQMVYLTELNKKKK